MQLLTKSTTSERVTAVVSTIVAVAVLGVAVSAQQSRTTSGDLLAQMESETRLQFRLAFRHDASEYEARLKALDNMLQAWRESLQSHDDHRLLTTWLRDAMAQSMPGNARPLPPTPDFSERQRLQPIVGASLLNQRENGELAYDDDGEGDFEPLPDVLDQSPPSVDYSVLPAPTLADPPVAVTEEVEDPTPSATEAPPAAASVNADAEQRAPTPEPARDATSMAAAAKIDAPESSQVEVVPAPPAPVLAPQPVAVNLSGLAERIQQYHRGLREVASSLAARSESPAEELERIARAVSVLEALVIQHDFVRLYYDALTPYEARLVAEPAAWSPHADAVRRELVRLAESRNGDFLEPFASDQGDSVSRLLQRVDSLVAH